MQDKRRKVLRGTAIALGAAVGMTPTARAAAAEWNKSAFGAASAADVLKHLGASNAAPSKEISFKAPDVAENGAAVPIEVASRIPDTQSIAVVADKNPFPLVATFAFTGGVEPYASTRIKLAASSDVRVIVMAGSRAYVATREIKVVTGGCG